MKEVTLKIPESKLDFFMELVSQLGLEVSEEDFVIPEEQKKMILDRVKYTREEDLLNWEDVKDDFDGI